jgi:hypothetical protein
MFKNISEIMLGLILLLVVFIAFNKCRTTEKFASLDDIKRWANNNNTKLNRWCENANTLNEGQYCVANCADNGWNPGGKIMKKNNDIHWYNKHGNILGTSDVSLNQYCS